MFLAFEGRLHIHIPCVFNLAMRKIPAVSTFFLLPHCRGQSERTSASGSATLLSQRGRDPDIPKATGRCYRLHCCFSTHTRAGGKKQALTRTPAYRTLYSPLVMRAGTFECAGVWVFMFLYSTFFRQRTQLHQLVCSNENAVI